MSAEAHASLGSDWLVAHGEQAGKLGMGKEAERAELRSSLLKDLESRLGRPSTAMREEVDRFLDSARISGSNLRRLEQRVLSLAGSGSRTARAKSASNSSKYSVGSQDSGPMTVRSNKMHSSLPAVREASADGLTAITPSYGRWSELAMYAKLTEEEERSLRHVRKQEAQQKMRQELQVQLDEKKQLSEFATQQAAKHVEHLHNDLIRWRSAEDQKAEERKQKVMEVRRDREEQMEQAKKRRELERQQKIAYDQQLLKQASDKIAQEQLQLLEKKVQKKALNTLAELAKNRDEERRRKFETKKAQQEEERKQVIQYEQILAEQRERNKPRIFQNIRKGKNASDDEPGSRAAALANRKAEAVADELLVKQQIEADIAAEESERQKLEQIRMRKQVNQDFIFQQISERQQLRAQIQEQKEKQKLAAQKECVVELEEKQRQEMERRSKIVRYRKDLEAQISSKKPEGVKDPDLMTEIEHSINQSLLVDVQGLKSRLKVVP